jgi:PASTA domain
MTRSRKLVGLVAIAGAAAAAVAGVSSAQGNDPGWGGIPHCTVPNLNRVQLSVAKRRLVAARCGVGLITRKRSHVAKGRVLLQVPAPGTEMAPGTDVDLTVSKGR